MNIKMSKRVVERAIDKKVPIMIWGPPGIGKSSFVRQITFERNNDKHKYPDGYDFVDLRLPQLDPTDLRGIPMPDREKDVCRWFPPEFLPDDRSGNYAPNGILFLDEIEKAIPAVKNAALQLVLDRKLGNYHLPSGWSIVAAGNREEDGAFSQPIGSALANRMTHIETECDHEVWLEWARKNGIEVDIIGFIEFQTMSALLPDHKERSGTGGRINAFATPRSWHMASDLICDVDSYDDRRILVASAVGEHMANTFIEWDKHYRSVDPKKIIESKMTKKYKESLEKKMKKSMGFRYALAMSCASYISNMSLKDVKKYSDNTTEFLKMLSPDLRVVFFRNIPSNFAFDITKDKKIMNAVSDILKIANED